MRLKLIACKVFYREISLLTATCKHFIDVTYLQQGLHDTPKKLNQALQNEIVRIDQGDDIYSTPDRHGQDFDAILIGYGLCSNGVVGLFSEKYRLVIPRIDDCIGLFLGSREHYKQAFDANPGTYWYTPSWIECAYTPSIRNIELKREKYVEMYGEENADYLIENEFSTDNYSTAAYIKWEGLDFPEYEEYTRQAAADMGWNYLDFLGKDYFLRDFIQGKWDERFLVVPPGSEVKAEYDGSLMSAAKKGEED
ncbi:MAG: DUF1638 domain-containing protein [Christensenellales bacterium]